MGLLVWSCVTSALLVAATSITYNKIACHSSDFEVSCPNEQVLLINKASYGRMKLNECASKDFGYLGCSKDVTVSLDRKCSGRHSCHFLVLDNVFQGSQCSEEIKSYLNVTYECVTVQIPENSQCSMGEIKVTSDIGYLSNFITYTTSCGGVSSPWTISGSPGQHIVLSLYDFTLDARLSRPDSGHTGISTSVCHHIFATIEDSDIRESICDQQERYLPVYTSKGHELQVAFEMQDKGENNYVLIHYAIEGCPDISSPENGWVKRNGQTALLGCNQEDIQWSLQCDHTHWVGHQFNCTAEGGAHTATTGGYFGHMSLSLGVVVVIVLGLAIAIGLLVLAAGLILMKRRNIEHERQEAMMLYGTKTPSSEIYGKHRPWVYERTNSQCSSQCMVHGARDYEYGTVVYGHRDYGQSPDIVQSSDNDLTQEQHQDLSMYTQSRNHNQTKQIHSSLGSLSESPNPRPLVPIQAKVQTNITIAGHHEPGMTQSLIDSKEEGCDICMGTQRQQTEHSCTMHTFKPALPQL